MYYERSARQRWMYQYLQTYINNKTQINSSDGGGYAELYFSKFTQYGIKSMLMMLLNVRHCAHLRAYTMKYTDREMNGNKQI